MALLLIVQVERCSLKTVNRCILVRSSLLSFLCRLVRSQRAKRVAFAVLVFLVLPLAATADSIGPRSSYMTPTPNGEYVFVMISPRSLEAETRNGKGKRANAIAAIRSVYVESGLYRNGGSTTPLWTVDWYVYNIKPFSDGIHLVRPGPWVSSPESEAVAFYSRGALLKSYTVSDLVSFPWLMPRTVSHFSWRSYESLLDQEKRYSIQTKHGEVYLFDGTTGNIIRQYRPHWLRFSVVVALCMPIRLLYVRKRKRGSYPKQALK